MAQIGTGKAAKIGNVTRETVQNHIRSGKLTATKTAGGHYRLDEAQVRAILVKDARLEWALS